MSRPRRRITLISEAALPSMPFLPQSTTEQADRGVGLDGDFRVLDPARLDHLEAHPLDRGDDLVDPEALEIVGVEHRRGEKEGESLEEVHTFWAPRRVGAQAAPRKPAQLRQDAGDRIKTFVRQAVLRRRRRDIP